MKQLIYLALLLGACSCETKKEANRFEVEGSIKNSGGGMVYLMESPAGGEPVIIDSTLPDQKGAFKLSALSRQEGMYSLRMAQNPYPFALLINDNNQVTVNADLMNQSNPVEVKGSPATQALIDYDRTLGQQAQQIYGLALRLDSLQKAGAPDSVKAVPFSAYESASASLKDFTRATISNAKSPTLALYAFGSYQRLSQQLGLSGFSKMEGGELINSTAARFPSSTAWQELKKSVVPQQAPDFSLPDTTGTPVALSSFRGKYVLVDFWASWCGPCRDENPNVVRAFNRFKDKNFTILGVSLDRNKEAWQRAIRADNLTWTHVSDLKYWNSAAAALYQVSSIPYNVLLDPSGKIVAENLRGEALEAKLAELIR
jgi:peroxiredoxin